MNISRSKLVAILTGFISVLICIVYLLLITVFDFRSFLNDQVTAIPNENLGVIFVDIFYLPESLFY